MTPMKVKNISDSLYFSPDIGFYIPKVPGCEVHFPAEGHARLAQIEHGSFWFRHRNRCIQTVVARSSVTGVFVEVGGGNGFVANGLRNQGLDIILVEPSIHGCRFAKERGIGTVINAEFSAAGFHPNSLPAVGLFDVLEHIEDDAAFLARLAETMPREGHLFLTVPAYNWLWSELDAASGHIRRYTLVRLKRLLASSGFDLEYGSHFFQLLTPTIYLSRVVGEKMFRKRRSIAKTTKHEHADTFLARLAERVLAYESLLIRRGVKLSFGASLIVSARKR